MALTLGDNFSYQGSKPLDARLKYDTLANMKAVADATMYEGCLAYCVATDKTYQWKSTNTVDADTGKWREFETGGASALSDLSDVTITSATNGQVLTKSNDGWVNGDAPKGVVQGYAYSSPGNDIEAIVYSFGQAIGKPLTTTSSAWTNNNVDMSNPTSVFALYNGEKVQIIASMTNFSVMSSNAKVFYYKASSSGNCRYKTTTSSNITDSNVTTFYTYYDGFLNINSSVPCSMYYFGNVVLTDVTYSEAPVLLDVVSPPLFYSDSAHTQLITPSTDKLYYDILTGSTYIWNGSSYVMTSGGAGASALEDLTDVDVTSPTSGDILKYDGSKWANAQFVIDMNPTSSSLNPVSSGGVFDGLATKYDTSDTAETGIDDADYFPFYDSSATAKKKSLWSNIKSVLKTYFDTLYSTVKSKGTPTSGGTDLSLVTTGDMYSWNLSVPTVMSATLSSGSASVTFTDVPTSGDKIISILTSKIGLEYDSVSQSGSTVTVTFPSQSSSVTVYLKIENV